MGKVNPRVSGNYNGQFTPAQLKALDKQPIYAKDFPKRGAYAISSEVPGFSTNNGWALCRFVCTSLPTAGASQYPFTFHSGNANYTLGMRINNGATTANSLGGYLRVNSVTKTNENAQFPVYANEIKTAILVWRDDGFQYLIVDDTYDFSTQTGARGFDAQLTTLSIGERNSAADPLSGQVIYLEIGNTYLTPEEATARLAACRNPITVAFAGQSNMQNWEDGVETTAPEGRRGFTETMAAIYGSAACPGEVLQIHAAEGGSSLFKTLNSSEYWLEDDGQPGPELTQFFQAVDATGHQPDFIFWHQGESESHTINDAGYPFNTRATYKARLMMVFMHMRNRYPKARIVIGALGVRTSFTNAGGIQTIAEIQQELIDTYSWIHYGWTCYDQTLNADGVHYQDASYYVHGQRGARTVQRLLGYNVSGGTLGPRVASAVRSGATVTVTLEHDGGTDFTPTTGIEGFSYVDNSGNAVAVSNVNRASATTITMTLASGVAGKLRYCYDNFAFTSLSNIVKDNGGNSLPLRRSVEIVVA